MFKDRDRWRVQWTDGHGKRRSQTFDSAQQAKRFEMEVELGIAAVADAPAKRVTFRQHGDRWLETYVKVEKAQSQWGRCKALLETHLYPAFGDVPLASLRQSHLLDLRAALGVKKAKGKKQVLSRKSVNLILAQAKQVMAHAAAHEVVPSNPWLGVKLLRLPKRDFAYWTPAERDAFAERAEARDPAFTRLVVFACHTGLRRGELAALRRRDVDFERGRIRVRGSYDFENDVLKETKGGEVADVTINAVARAAVAPARFLTDLDAPVFDRALFKGSCRKRLARLAKAVGVAPIRFHDLRHTFASCLAMAGLDLLVIQQLLRHKSYQMTLRYAHLHPDHLAGATDVLCTPNARGAASAQKSPGQLGG